MKYTMTIKSRTGVLDNNFFGLGISLGGHGGLAYMLEAGLAN